MARHRLFLSYKRGDPMTSVVERFHRRLRAQFRRTDLETFFDRRSIDAGDDFEIRIDEFLADTTLFVAFVSIDFWLSSQCMRELGIALKRRRAGQLPRLLFVLADYLDPATLSLDEATAANDVDQSLAHPRADDPLTGDEPYTEGELGRFNFLGPYDAAGRLVRLDIEHPFRCDEQLNSLVEALRPFVGRT